MTSISITSLPGSYDTCYYCGHMTYIYNGKYDSHCCNCGKIKYSVTTTDVARGTSISDASSVFLSNSLWSTKIEYKPVRSKVLNLIK